MIGIDFNLPGDHDSLVTPPYITCLVAELRDCIDAAGQLAVCGFPGGALRDGTTQHGVQHQAEAGNAPSG